MKLISVDYAPFPSFAEAASAAGVGYADPALVSDQARKRDISKANIIGQPAFNGHCIAALGVALAAQPALSRLLRTPLRVLDYGGAGGGHYGVARSTFKRARFSWTVAEQPMYVDYGRRTVANSDVHFVEDASAAEAPDIAYYCGVLQYLPDPFAALSRDILRNAPFVFIVRTIFEDEEQPFLQTANYDTGPVRYPGRIMSMHALSRHMTALGYGVHTSWRDDAWCLNKARAAPAMLWAR